MTKEVFVPGASRNSLRLNYLIGRVKALNLPRVWQLSGDIGKNFRKPRLAVAIDMFWSAAKYECAFQDYQDWDFALLSGKERATFMTHPKSDHYARRFNTNREANLRLADKSNFNAEFGDLLGREWLDLRKASDDELAAFVERHPNLMAKVPDSLGGKGIERIRPADIGTDLAKFRSQRIRDRQFLLEEFLTQHDHMRDLNESSVNTMRIVTFNSGERVDVIAVALRIGAGGDVDNFSGGGMYTMVDEHGIAQYPAFDDNNAIHAIHPLSGVPIVGFEVPHFAAALDLVAAAAKRIPEVPYVGWDVAIGPERPVLIEGNYNTGVFQAKPSVSGQRRGLLPRYRAVVGE
ncbi:sugar-transfer associated ATP-grasp domain-containing protein [Gulosibacter faecalis]|uniref:Sugar-transfer associated ATP-grasp domain-containing protein n=1 Tax=Gulosibacter faecalis TaxID=272240 RepID=A0ABW5UY35_9MICO|nr:sugar-transfer associated ATP-grasp domain-containing protein [Gulosibacter faecalis]